jgi:hypothetical protein
LKKPVWPAAASRYSGIVIIIRLYGTAGARHAVPLRVIAHALYQDIFEQHEN